MEELDITALLSPTYLLGTTAPSQTLIDGGRLTGDPLRRQEIA